ncbi:hypothetical protein KJ586_01790, partial [Patescibacteria group bacterium]|nr:hypothetical protein [Patescibacteria group bacterium]
YMDKVNMKKFQEYTLSTQAILVYLLSAITSLILAPIFSKFYVMAYKPDLIGGGFFVYAPKLEIYLGGIFAGYLLFLSLFVFWLIKKRQWLICLIGAIVILLTSLNNSARYILWDFILIAAGWLLAQGILLIKKRGI